MIQLNESGCNVANIKYVPRIMFCCGLLWPSTVRPLQLNEPWRIWVNINRADSRLALSQWETALLCNDVSHWLGANLESALYSLKQSTWNCVHILWDILLCITQSQLINVSMLQLSISAVTSANTISYLSFYISSRVLHSAETYLSLYYHTAKLAWIKYLMTFSGDFLGCVWFKTHPTRCQKVFMHTLSGCAFGDEK